MSRLLLALLVLFSSQIVSAALVLRPIQRLFWFERAIKRRAAENKLSWEGLMELREEVRQRRSVRLSEQIHLDAQPLLSVMWTCGEGVQR